MEERTVGREEYEAIKNKFFEKHSAGTEPICENNHDGTTYVSTYRFTDGAAWVEEVEWKPNHDLDLVSYAIETGMKVYRTPFFRPVGGETYRKNCEITTSVYNIEIAAQNAIGSPDTKNYDELMASINNIGIAAQNAIRSSIEF